MSAYPDGAYAVVCFADLLKEERKRHMKSFKSNSYIVMNKKWALDNLVTPVLYYHSGTVPSAFMKNWCEYIINNNLTHKTDNSIDLPVKTTSIMFAFMKQYEGVYFDKKRKKFSEEKRIFYLEREWRWIPHVTQGEAYYLPREEYLDEDIHQRELTKLINHGLVLEFNYDNIEEIGIPSDKGNILLQTYPELSNKIKYINS